MKIDSSKALVLCANSNRDAKRLGKLLAENLKSELPLQVTSANAQSKTTQPSIIVTVGGDGTILRAVQLAAPLDIPLLGVNMGRLGFLTEIEAEDAIRLVPKYLSSQSYSWPEYRQMVQVERIGSTPYRYTIMHALNEVVIGRGVADSLSRIHVYIDGMYLSTYAADSIIVSTATGSTAYSLSAGGPILHPSSGDLVLTPVAPHGDLSSPLVLPAESVVELEIEGNRSKSVSADGGLSFSLKQGEYVRVSGSPYRSTFLRSGSKSSFYETLVYRLRRGSDQTISVARKILENR